MKNFFAKIGLSVLAVMLMVSSVFAGNFVVGVEYSNVEQDLETVYPILNEKVLQISDYYVNLEITENIKDINLIEELVILGYKINDNFTPYILLGNGNLSFNQEYMAIIKRNHAGIELDTSESFLLAESDFKENDLMYGAGISGDLYKFENGIKFSYDANVRFMEINNEALWSYIPYYDYDSELHKVNTDVEYRKISGNLIVSKEFVINKKEEVTVSPILNSITPFIGVQVSQVDLNIVNTVNNGDEEIIKTEQNSDAVLTSAILGAEVKIKDNWLLKVNALVGDEKGYTAKVSYLF